jgi:hypothetical protein
MDFKRIWDAMEISGKWVLNVKSVISVHFEYMDRFYVK